LKITETKSFPIGLSENSVLKIPKHGQTLTISTETSLDLLLFKFWHDDDDIFEFKTLECGR
jgi:hypothetical protein